MARRATASQRKVIIVQGWRRACNHNLQHMLAQVDVFTHTANLQNTHTTQKGIRKRREELKWKHSPGKQAETPRSLQK